MEMRLVQIRDQVGDECDSSAAVPESVSSL